MLWKQVKKIFRKDEEQKVVRPAWRGLILADIIKKNKCQKIAEIGVLKGITAKKILEECHDVIDEYWAIDKWNPVHENYLSGRIRGYNQEDWDRIYSKVIKLSIQYPKLKVVRIPSVPASKLFPDNFFDLVFIDAEHEYNAVKSDILNWFPKIKTGGLISGHDYGARKTPDVKHVVDKIFGSRVRTFLDSVWVVRI